MAQSTFSSTQKSVFERKDLRKSHDLLTCTIKSPPFSYAHLEVVTDGPEPLELDNLQVKSFLTTALRQFLGITGASISVDILKVQDSQCWVRVPQPDLASFAAAITTWRGTSEGGSHSILRVRQCSDWLGTLVGSDGQDQLWTS